MTGFSHSLLLVGVVAVVTALTRFLPFLLFPDGRTTPRVVVYLGTVLPCAIMGMLVVYCLRGVSFSAPPHGLPEAIAVGVVVLLYIWKRNTLLSILAGTACYMALVQLVFV